MDNKAFIAAYNESRNGTNDYYRHPIAIGGRFLYTSGVREIAEAGTYWLLDIIATECLLPLRACGNYTSLVEVVVKQEVATIKLTINEGKPPIWKKIVPWTDMPEGRWVFELVQQDETSFIFSLISEH